MNEDRRLVEVERPVDLGHDRHGALVVGADDDAVGTLEIVDGRAFAQEFRVGDDGEVGVRAAVSRMMRSTSSPVPTGTVDLVTTTV